MNIVSGWFQIFCESKTLGPGSRHHGSLDFWTAGIWHILQWWFWYSVCRRPPPVIFESAPACSLVIAKVPYKVGTGQYCSSSCHSCWSYRFTVHADCIKVRLLWILIEERSSSLRYMNVIYSFKIWQCSYATLEHGQFKVIRYTPCFLPLPNQLWKNRMKQSKWSINLTSFRRIIACNCSKPLHFEFFVAYFKGISSLKSPSPQVDSGHEFTRNLGPASIWEVFG